MADLNKIKDKIARHHGYKNWFHMVSSKLGPYIPFDEVVDKYTAAHTAALRERVENLSVELRLSEDTIKHQADRCMRLLERVKELESELEHHKRVIFSLQTDLENKKWFDVYEKDLIFLREILDRFLKSDKDVTQREYVEQMLKDWIAELEAK